MDETIGGQGCRDRLFWWKMPFVPNIKNMESMMQGDKALKFIHKMNAQACRQLG